MKSTTIEIVFGQGYVSLEDHMPVEKLERAVVNAARVSYIGGVREIRDEVKDGKMIKRMWTAGHTSPFEQVVFKFKIHAPLFIVQQLLRHRTARINQQSGRYSKLDEKSYVPSIERLGKLKGTEAASKSESAIFCQKVIAESHKAAFKTYNLLLQHGVKKELARIVLPAATYTTLIYQLDLHNLLKFLQNRLAKSAQYEMRAYALAMLKLVKDLVPVATQHLHKYLIP